MSSGRVHEATVTGGRRALHWPGAEAHGGVPARWGPEPLLTWRQEGWPRGLAPLYPTVPPWWWPRPLRGLASQEGT